MPTKQKLPLQSKIRIQRTPDPRERTHRGVIPQQSRSPNPKLVDMGVMEFVRSLFELNERLPPRERMTDAEIARQIVENYPHTGTARSIKAHLDGKGGRTVSYWRAHYNSGHICPFREPPKIQSQRYNDMGEPFHTKATARRVRPKRRQPPRPLRELQNVLQTPRTKRPTGGAK